MSRTGRTALLLATVAALTLPAQANAGCTSDYPVSDKRLAQHSCTGVHPGMGLIVPSKKYEEMQCTAGFVFADQFGTRYTSVPGTCHLDYDCLEDEVADLLPPPLNEIVDGVPVCLAPGDSELEPNYGRSGPVVKDLDGRRVGRIVYAVNKNGVNFALIRIDSDLKVDPAVPLYGGPTRLLRYSGNPAEAYVYGQPRPGLPNAGTGVLWTLGGETFHQSPLFDYGALVLMPDGSGVGYESGLNWVGEGAEVLSYAPALDRAERRTKLSFRLLTAPAAP